VLIVEPFIPVDQPNPRGYEFPTSLRGVNFGFGTSLRPPLPPFYQTDYPNPTGPQYPIQLRKFSATPPLNLFTFSIFTATGEYVITGETATLFRSGLPTFQWDPSYSWPFPLSPTVEFIGYDPITQQLIAIFRDQTALIYPNITIGQALGIGRMSNPATALTFLTPL
jgi:hypothetical protein